MNIIKGKEAEYQAYVEKNGDPYGSGVVRFEKRWAELMENGIADGNPLEEIAKDCASVADLEGITGYMYGCAVSSLSHFWVHGEELRRWHNLKTQMRNEGEKANAEGGVLNPTILNISTIA